MKKLFSILMLTSFMATPVLADQGYEFYSNDSQNWHIGGYSGDTDAGGLNPACYAEQGFQDGSRFQIIKDLADGEVYIWIRNVVWDIYDAPGEYSLRLNIVNRRGDILRASGNYYYVLENKNTILIRGLNVDEFIPSFMDGSELRLVMPGTIQNAFIPLDGTSTAVAMIAECMQSSIQVKLNFPPQESQD